jgi:hypothetical protein
VQTCETWEDHVFTCVAVSAATHPQFGPYTNKTYRCTRCGSEHEEAEWLTVKKYVHQRPTAPSWR